MSLLVVPPLIIGVVLLISGVLKIRRPADAGELEALGLPAPLRAAWLVRLHPWGEAVLGAALLVLGGILGVLSALAALVLMSGYLWLVAAALLRRTASSCACFGSSRPITRLTVIRNGWLVLLALAALSVSGRTPLWGGPLAAVDGWDWLWVLGMLAAVVTAVLIVAPERAELGAEPARVASPASEDDADYIRARTPAVLVALANGTMITLRDLTAVRPALLFAVSPGCGSCEVVLSNLAGWRSLLPEIDLRLILASAPEDSELVEQAEPQSLHDPNRYVPASLGYEATPSAVLLGADGLLAGGPVTGSAQIARFIDDVYESLHGTPPPR